MKSETMRIADLISEISMGPFGSNIKVECFVEEGIPVLNGGNLDGFVLKEDSFRYVTEEKANSLGKANAHRGDVVITHRGTLGQIVFIPQNSLHDRYVISQSQFRVKCNEKVLPEYLVYYFHTRIGQYKLLSNASQVGVPALARASTTFQTIEIEVPDLGSQRKIVGVLEAIRRKVEINNAINENLAAQARTMFQQWLTKATGSLCQLAEIADINPETYSTKDNWEFVNYLDTSNITTGTIAEVQYIQPSQEKLPSRARRILSNNDIVYSTVRPNQLHFGIISNPLPNMLGSTGFAVIRSKRKNIPNEMIYLALTDPIFVEKMHQLAEQSVSTYPSIKPLDLNACVIPEPQQDDTDFTNTVITFFDIIASNNEENRRLAELRDTLLPRLMSGKLDVSSLDL